jgi:thiamine-monophosphate kinase
MKQESQLVEKILRSLRLNSTSSFSGSHLSWDRRSPGPRSRSAKRGSVLATSVTLGPGDDAAVIAPSGKTELVLTCDASLEGVHFRRDTHPPESIGYKSLARATSDLAAMGAAPRFFLLTLGLPTAIKAAWLDKFLRGMRRAAREFDLNIIGGDTTASPQVVISITVLGEIAPGLAVGRSGARPGDLIYVSGRLGRAQLGLELVLAGRARDSRLRAVLAPHLYPKIRIGLGSWLARYHLPTAMMDLSDGLSTDLTRLCRASGVGARIFADRVPCPRIPSLAEKKMRGHRFEPLEMALHGGEDYELLFTVPKSKVESLKKSPEYSLLTRIGEITAEKSLHLIRRDGREETLKPGGWDPF